MEKKGKHEGIVNGLQYEYTGWERNIDTYNIIYNCNQSESTVSSQ